MLCMNNLYTLRIRCFLQLFLLLFCPLFTLAQYALFQSDELIHLRIEADLSALQEDRGSDPELP